MFPIQVHLAMVHVPVLAMLFATALLFFSGFRDRMDWKRMAFTVYILGGIGGVIAFLSGHGSEDIAHNVLSLSHERIHEHEEAGNFALAFCMATGLISFVLLFLEAKLGNRNRRLLTRALLMIGLLGSVALARTAHLGGQIRHPEIAPDSPSTLIPPKSVPEPDDKD
jgi:formate hydrogenlyase subunit 3/multisubunit Na+/H+ antiporter MnhD subunit